jgi:hypothetical protein
VRPGIATRGTLLVAIPLLLALAGACSSDGAREDPAPLLTAIELRDPSTCAACHAGHVAGWSSSMHAHASRDPVFLAMNRRGQEETKGELGAFCVRCHAPLAVAEGLTTDGLNLESLPDEVQGVTCYYCHTVAEVTEDHNNGLVPSQGDELRGPLDGPIAGAPHQSAYSPLHDSEKPASSALCGSCHDVVLPNDVKLERTALEWRGSAFAPDNPAAGARALGCASCHMPLSPHLETAGGSGHAGHDHHFAAVDVALTPTLTDDEDDDDDEAPGSVAIPGGDQRALVQSLLDVSLGVEICVQRMSPTQAALYVTLENIGAGHDFPSGASHDRRVWVHIAAFDAAGSELYASGKTPPDSGAADADLWSLHDDARDANGGVAHMFWDTVSVDEHAIPAPVTFDPASRDASANALTRRFPRSRTKAISGAVARVTVTAKLRPIGLDVLDDLIGSRHLDASVRERMPQFDLIPNRHLEGAPVLSSLSTVTFEWSPAVKESGHYTTRILNDDAFPKDCVSTTAP